MLARRSMLLAWCCFVAVAPIRASEITLPNSILWIEWPGGSGTRISAGYRTGVRHEPAESGGVRAMAVQVFAAQPAVRSLGLYVHGVGGSLRFTTELDWMGVEIELPDWAVDGVAGPLSACFAAPPAADPSVLAFARTVALGAAEAQSQGFRAMVEDEIRRSLLGSHPYHRAPEGRPANIDAAADDQVRGFLNSQFGTDRISVLVAGRTPATLRQQLESIAARSSARLRETPYRVAAAERTFRFAVRENQGSVVLASPLPSVHFRSWYTALVMSDLLGGILSRARQTLVPTVDTYYYRIELPVESGQLPETVEEHIMQEVQRLQLVRPQDSALRDARASATAVLDSAGVRGWFALQGLTDRWTEGRQWVASTSGDDIRTAARDLIIANRVLATWSPKSKETLIEVESLSGGADPPPALVTSVGLTDRVTTPPLPTAPATPRLVPERLGNGLTLVPWDSTHALFMSGSRTLILPAGRPTSGPNGTLWIFERQPSPAVRSAISAVSPRQIIVFCPVMEMDSCRSEWRGAGTQSSTAEYPVALGRVASGDLPALFLLKTLLERRAIETGWADITLAIDATRGSELQIDASGSRADRVRGWIQELAATGPADTEIEWARSAARQQLRSAARDLQILIWQRDPEGALPSLDTISVSHIREVARLYF